MTTTPTDRTRTSSLADDVRLVHGLPPTYGSTADPQEGPPFLAQVGRDIGVTGSRVWQLEMRLDKPPVTVHTVRYARLLADLDGVAVAA